MRSINFEDGYEEFSINGDESRTIRFNPGDLNMGIRAQEAVERITQWQEKLKDIKLKPDGTPGEESEIVSDVLGEFNVMLRKELNYIFGSDVYDAVFAGQSPLCLVGKDKMFLFEAFVLSVSPIIQTKMEAFGKASQERVGKYTKGYRK